MTQSSSGIDNNFAAADATDFASTFTHTGDDDSQDTTNASPDANDYPQEPEPNDDLPKEVIKKPMSKWLLWGGLTIVGVCVSILGPKLVAAKKRAAEPQEIVASAPQEPVNEAPVALPPQAAPIPDPMPTTAPMPDPMPTPAPQVVVAPSVLPTQTPTQAQAQAPVQAQAQAQVTPPPPPPRVAQGNTNSAATETALANLEAEKNALAQKVAALEAKNKDLTEALARAKQGQAIKSTNEKLVVAGVAKASERSVKASKRVPNKPEAPSEPSPAATELLAYQVKMIVPGQAWVIDKSGEQRVITVGSLLGSAKVTAIDPDAMIITTSAGVIKPRT